MKSTSRFGVVGALVFVLAGGALPASAEETIGEIPGEFKGRWLQIYDRDGLTSFDVVVIGDTKTDIAWKWARNEAPLEERELDAQLREQLNSHLKESGLYEQVLDQRVAGEKDEYLRVDCDLEVEPGSRLLRSAPGDGAGESKSVLECEFVDHASSKVLALYHGYGTETGKGLKGGDAAKMTKDDNQENAAKIVELLKRVNGVDSE